MTPKTYTARYGPTKAAAQSVAKWLRDSGLMVTSLAPGRQYLSVKGTAAQVNKAFATTMTYYRKSGALRRAPATTPSVPTSVAPEILGVTRLAASTARMKPATVPPPDGFRNARPCSS